MGERQLLVEPIRVDGCRVPEYPIEIARESGGVVTSHLFSAWYSDDEVKVLGDGDFSMGLLTIGRLLVKACENQTCCRGGWKHGLELIEAARVVGEQQR